mgnify:CR=1 FL=1|tara:strand:- start:23 stop:787 length:765 start_codon:yes stop_codon:yes gene_type:complete
MIPSTNEDNRIPEDIYEYGDNYKNIGAINVAMEQAIEKLGFCSGCGVDEFFPAEIECDDEAIVQQGIWDIYVPVSALKMNPMINESQMCMRIGRIVKTIQKTLLDSHPAIIEVSRPRLWRIDQYVFSDRQRSIHFEPDIDVAFHFNAQITCSVDELWKLLDTPEKFQERRKEFISAMFPYNSHSFIGSSLYFRLYLKKGDIHPERLLYGAGNEPDGTFEGAWLEIHDGLICIAIDVLTFLEYVNRLMARAKEQS